MLSLLVFSLGVSIPLSVFAGTPNKADYPPMDKLAPANAAWGSNVLSNVPSIPVGTVPLTVTDWSKDVTTCPQQNQWGLTYDDGPGPLTDDLLGELAKRKTTATFFVIGSRVLERPDVLLRTYQAGHHIGIHTWSHPYLSTVSNEQIIAEITYTIMAVKTVIGVTPAFVRPPYGDIDDRVRTVLTNLGLTIVEWNVDPQDTAARGDVAQQFATKANAGSAGVISLEHDMFQTTEPQAAAALDAIMAGSGGYKPMPVAECLGKNPYDEGFWTKLGISAPDGGSVNSTTTSSNTTISSTSQIPINGTTSSNTTIPSTSQTSINGTISSNTTIPSTPPTSINGTTNSTLNATRSTINPTSSPTSRVVVPASSFNAGISKHSINAAVYLTSVIMGALILV
ncbi:chitin deacetylase [Batrachochytrium dendrobatidis]|nr:chitin deacetylase [Batrachochytrium dendrobatidis]